MAVRIGHHIFELGSYGQYALDGVDSPALEGEKIGGFRIYYESPSPIKHKFDIVLDKENNITLSSYKDIVRVDLNGESTTLFNNSLGLLGKVVGETVARDGTTVMTDPDEFGQEWQVRDDEPKLFRTNREPQYPAKCRLPGDVDMTTLTRGLGAEVVTHEEASKACARFDGMRKEHCIYDGK